MKTYYITINPPIENNHIEIQDIVGKIDLIESNNPTHKAVIELLQTGNYHISPYGYGEKDENGNIIKFELMGFSITNN